MDGYKKERMDDYLNKLIVSLSVELFKKEVNDGETNFLEEAYMAEKEKTE